MTAAREWTDRALTTVTGGWLRTGLGTPKGPVTIRRMDLLLRYLRARVYRRRHPEEHGDHPRMGLKEEPYQSIWTERAINTLNGGWLWKYRSPTALTAVRLGLLSRYLRARMARKMAGELSTRRMCYNHQKPQNPRR